MFQLCIENRALSLSLSQTHISPSSISLSLTGFTTVPSNDDQRPCNCLKLLKISNAPRIHVRRADQLVWYGDVACGVMTPGGNNPRRFPEGFRSLICPLWVWPFYTLCDVMGRHRRQYGRLSPDRGAPIITGQSATRRPDSDGSMINEQIIIHLQATISGAI